MFLNVLMADWSNKNIRNLNVGDKVMGPDFKPREVTEVAEAFGTIYDTSLTSMNPSFMIGEGNMIMVKKSRTHEAIRMTMRDFVSHCIKMRPGYYSFQSVGRVDFPEKQITIPPYFLGLWLGKGTENELEIEANYPPIIAYLAKFATRHHLQPIWIESSKKILFTTNGNNHLKQSLDILGLMNEKHIPFDYIHNTIDNRQLLLAGIIDSIGVIHNGTSYRISIPQNRWRLANDIALLARLLGYFTITTMAPSNRHYNVFIRGNLCHEIPAISEWKITKKTYYAIKPDFKFDGVIAVVNGYYTKVAVTGDGRYLTNNFMVLTHDMPISNNTIPPIESEIEKPNDTIHLIEENIPSLSATDPVNFIHDDVVQSAEDEIHETNNTPPTPENKSASSTDSSIGATHDDTTDSDDIRPSKRQDIIYISDEEVVNEPFFNPLTDYEVYLGDISPSDDPPSKSETSDEIKRITYKECTPEHLLPAIKIVIRKIQYAMTKVKNFTRIDFVAGLNSTCAPKEIIDILFRMHDVYLFKSHPGKESVRYFIRPNIDMEAYINDLTLISQYYDIPILEQTTLLTEEDTTFHDCEEDNAFFDRISDDDEPITNLEQQPTSSTDFQPVPVSPPFFYPFVPLTANEKKRFSRFF